MTDRPILFSPSMVQAILREIAQPGAGKTVTRRKANSPVLRLTTRGDTLWVREACVTDDRQQRAVAYLADGEIDPSVTNDYAAPRNAFHMPRWASRLTLSVTATRVERLQAITEADARAEGVESVAHFQALWDVLHDPGAWDQNPEVIVIRFRPRLGNIDVLAAARDALVPS